MDPIIVTSALFKLGFALASVAMLIGTLQLLDWLLGIKFGEVYAELKEARGTAMAIYFGARILAIAHLIGCGLGALLMVAAMSSPADADPFPKAYDSEIKAAWAIYHPGDDWRWWKAQLWQESHLNPNAVSPVGAAGIAQFMPATGVQYGLTDRRLAAPSIHAGAKLMRDNLRFWKAPRTAVSRRRLAQAGYNCGNGNLVKAQARCDGPREYEPIMVCLPAITGRFAKETAGYVPRIQRWYEAML